MDALYVQWLGGPDRRDVSACDPSQLMRLAMSPTLSLSVSCRPRQGNAHFRWSQRSDDGERARRVVLSTFRLRRSTLRHRAGVNVPGKQRAEPVAPSDGKWVSPATADRLVAPPQRPVGGRARLPPSLATPAPAREHKGDPVLLSTDQSVEDTARRARRCARRIRRGHTLASDTTQRRRRRINFARQACTAPTSPTTIGERFFGGQRGNGPSIGLRTQRARSVRRRRVALAVGARSTGARWGSIAWGADGRRASFTHRPPASLVESQKGIVLFPRNDGAIAMSPLRLTSGFRIGVSLGVANEAAGVRTPPATASASSAAPTRTASISAGGRGRRAAHRRPLGRPQNVGASA